jgi:hypothetical protein
MKVFKISNRLGVLTTAEKTTGLGKITENIKLSAQVNRLTQTKQHKSPSDKEYSIFFYQKKQAPKTHQCRQA